MRKQVQIKCTCGTLFMGNPNRRFCCDCRNKSLMARTTHEPRDLSPEEIDRRFAIALSAVRREGLHAIPAGWNMTWRYSNAS